MNIFVTHSSNYDFKNDLYIPLRKSELNNLHTIFLPHEKETDIVTKDIIKTCDIVIAEVSFPSTGQGIELGWANTYQIPIICIYKKDSKTSNSLNKITDTFIIYENSEDMIEKLTSSLNEIK
jgi:nucleoside 2-deoxyribosyltransferase